MVVATQTWELALSGCGSLREKRSVIRSLRDRLRARLNVSVAETGLQDVHTRVKISIALVAGDGHLAQSLLDKAECLVESHGGASIVRVTQKLY